ncbi:ABC transporter permease [Ectopseudomonas mendocina]|nr:FtsX-like permease family protein [Pseudomonas mendocina]TRO21696.1 ABC transporter permease [Pseudomonas mendocina]TRO27951.1 ABC transporter permease [Pseudomonas mendocina]
MRPLLIAGLAWQDYRRETRLSACAVLALVAVIAPLLVLFGLKHGLVGSLTERLQRDPAVREIIPLGGTRLQAEFIEALSQREDVAFAIPRTRQIAATSELQVAPGEARVSVEMLPTAAGDPLLQDLPVPQALQQVVLSHTAADKLGITPGSQLQARFGRQRGNDLQWQQTTLQVLAVLPLAAFERDALFAQATLLEAVEDYRDGLAVAALGWPGATSTQASRIYPGFRLYARALEDVEPLRQYLAAQQVQVVTQAAQIAQVQTLSRNLDLLFWLITTLALGGALAATSAGTLAAIERKQRELAVLRLLGFGSGALLFFVILQALYSGLFASVLSALLYRLAEGGINHLFVQVPGDYASRLLPEHYLVALGAVLLASALAAALGGRRVARIDASQGIRDV